MGIPFLTSVSARPAGRNHRARGDVVADAFGVSVLAIGFELLDPPANALERFLERLGLAF
jgi:hypothetical protein